MARWRLRQKHYLNVPGTKWEYEETNRNTGKRNRVAFSVPVHLDPEDPSDHNYPGEVIVANKEDRAYRNDIIFLGEPTPDMEPIDDEAQAISDALRPKWQHPIESLPGDFSASLISNFERQMKDLMNSGQAKPANPVSAGSVSAEEFAKLQEQVAALMAKNAELESKQGKRRAV